jgi:hypothetical protein
MIGLPDDLARRISVRHTGAAVQAKAPNGADVNFPVSRHWAMSDKR